ncbi:hypothetical protein SDC9_116004 [bioreactor metagenome]|uniref:Uncharacterized protein n=1 Tax=bioreactor metagenome TaxID=1076179 RepID=A0A645BUE0_9ZZZZ
MFFRLVDAFSFGRFPALSGIAGGQRHIRPVAFLFLRRKNAVGVEIVNPQNRSIAAAIHQRRITLFGTGGESVVPNNRDPDRLDLRNPPGCQHDFILPIAAQLVEILPVSRLYGRSARGFGSRRADRHHAGHQYRQPRPRPKSSPTVHDIPLVPRSRRRTDPNAATDRTSCIDG